MAIRSSRRRNMDKLYAASVRLTDFHVDPTCSPTRSALLTGRYSTRTGVWHTINGRSMMHPDELTLAETFKANGYRTAMIGKWHLGDNYPCRPEDQGFDHVVRHQGGGVGNGPDYWQNDYFDDTFKVNGKWQKFDGYCTDVWFREATKYVETNKDQPFFLYLATNAPHGPYYVDDKYAEPYEAAGMPKTMAKFYGMITNIDENLGRFRARLDELGLTENTLLIFMTDNGTTAGWIDSKSGYKYYNAGMRGWKGSQWDGGHRVPCYFYWPAGGLTGRPRRRHAHRAHRLAADAGRSARARKTRRAARWTAFRCGRLLLGEKKPMPERTLFAHVQRSFLPPKWDTVRRDDRALATDRRRATVRHHRRPRSEEGRRRGSSRCRQASARRLRDVVDVAGAGARADRPLWAGRRGEPDHAGEPRLADARRRASRLAPEPRRAWVADQRSVGGRRRAAGDVRDHAVPLAAVSEQGDGHQASPPHDRQGRRDRSRWRPTPTSATFRVTLKKARPCCRPG